MLHNEGMWIDIARENRRDGTVMLFLSGLCIAAGAVAVFVGLPFPIPAMYWFISVFLSTVMSSWCQQQYRLCIMASMVTMVREMSTTILEAPNGVHVPANSKTR